MEYFSTTETIGIRTITNNNIIQIEFNNINNIIILNINESELIINREYIINNISPNFTVEMFYNILLLLIKYDNYKFQLLVENNTYLFEGYYFEPYDQGDEIHINLWLR